MMHQQTIMTNMGTADFPAPRRMPAAQWENAGRKVKRGDGSRLGNAAADDVRIPVKSSNENRHENIKGNTDQFG